MQAVQPAPAGPSPIDALITLQPLAVSSSGEVSYAGPSTPATAALAATLNDLNLLTRHLQSLPPTSIFPPPPQPQPNQRSLAVAKYKDEGNVLFKRSDWAGAIRAYTASADLAASRPSCEANVYARDELAVVLGNRSAAYEKQGDWTRALVDAEAIIKLKSPWPKGYFRKGRALAGAGRLEEAREALLLGLQFDPTSEDLVAATTDVERRLRERNAAAAS